MDPNANLAEQETLVNSLTRDGHDNDRLLDLRLALAHWIDNGGFAPNWDKYPIARRAYGRWHMKHSALWREQQRGR
jgi:hypothetical protein